MDWLETPVSFGQDGSLVGVFTQPTGGSRAPIGCLLLNVGVNHRIGPRRLNVKAARQLAQCGVPCLRFDLSGVGDSIATTGQSDFRQQAVLDMRAALDQFEASTGLRKFIVFGICSGAVNGLNLALADPRVVGLATLDGHIFLDKRVRIERKLRRWAAFPFNASVRRSYAVWLAWSKWARSPFDPAARRSALDQIRGRLAPRTTQETGLFDDGAPPYTAADFEREMQVLLARNVDLYLMYSNTLVAVDHGFDLQSALRGAEFLQRVRYRFWPDVDHTATTLHAQRQLINEVCAWAGEVSAKTSGKGPAPLQEARRNSSYTAVERVAAEAC